MSYKLWLLSVVVAITMSIAFAASPVGSVSSMGSLELSGTRVSASTVSSWPVVTGDEIATTTLPAVIFLKDKSRVTLAKNSRVRIERDGDRTDVRLLGGSLLYKLASSSALSFVVGQRRIPDAGLQGTLGMSGVAAAQKPVELNYGVARTPVPSNVNPF